MWKNLGILGFFRFSNCEPRFEARTKVPELLQEKDWSRKNTAHLLFVVSTTCVFFGVFFDYPTFFPCNTQSCRLIFFWHPSKSKAFKGFSF